MKNRVGTLSLLLLLPVFSQGLLPVSAQQSADAGMPAVVQSEAMFDQTERERQSRTIESEPASSLQITYDETADDKPVLSNTQGTDLNQVDGLSNQILSYEIELLKLNTDFRMKSTDKNRIKPWRTFLYNLGGAGVATAGITTIAAERWRTWRKPAAASRTALKAGPIMLLTSHSIIAGGILLEAALDLANDQKVKKAGFDTKSTKKKALELVGQIDEKLKERERLLSGLTTLSEEERGRASAETPILKDLRNMSVSEYCNFHVRAKKRLAARNFSYLNGLAAATTGGYLGSLCGLLAVSCRKPRLAGPAGLGFTLSGAQIATGPELARLAGNCVGSLDKRLMKKDFGAIPKSQLSEHLTSLRQYPFTNRAAIAQRLSIYESVTGVLKRQAEMNAAEKKKADREYIERCLFNAAIGGSKMAWGIQLMNAGYGFSPAVAKAQSSGKPAAKSSTGALSNAFGPTRSQKTQAQLFGQRVAQGATSYIPGTSLWILDTLQARTRGEMDVYTMGQQATLPHQKLADRMNKLKEMESKLKEISQ